jgi:hypothetical protein
LTARIRRRSGLVTAAAALALLPTIVTAQEAESGADLPTTTDPLADLPATIEQIQYTPYQAVDDAIRYYGMGRWHHRIHTICARESNYNPQAYNANQVGLFQFIPSTWVYACRLTGTVPFVYDAQGRLVGDTRTNASANAMGAVVLMCRGEWSHWRATDPGW